MKVGYVGIFNEVVISKAYHNYGYTRATLIQLKKYFGNDNVEIITHKNNFNDYDALFIDEGANFENYKWNKIGGDFSKTISNLNQLNNYKGKIYYNKTKEIPDYNNLINKRKLNITNFKMPDFIPIDFILSSDKLALGDSHTTSVVEEGFAVKSINGKTLYSYIKDGLNIFVPDHIKHLRFYAGNIDIRFHFYRLNVNLSEIVLELEKQLLNLQLETIDIIQPLYIEPETREMSSTMGSYKGQFFYGSLEERQKIRDNFSKLLEEMCIRNSWNYLKWNNLILNENNVMDVTCMEPKRGPHLKYEYYMFK